VRVLVTGGTGLLGWWVAKSFVEAGYEVYATHHSQGPVDLGGVKWVRVDLGDPRQVDGVLGDVRPEVVIHCAAYTDVDGCEVNKQYAYTVNYVATRLLAGGVARRDGFLVYVSTDYVFDGERGMYREDDVPNPVNFYGLSKLLGEVAVESLLEGSSTVVRVSGLYGYSPTGKRNFGVRALEDLSQGRVVYAFEDQYLSPTYVPQLAQGITRIVERGITGTLHVAGERLSRYEFALILAEELRADRSLVKPASLGSAKLVARRPRDSSLDTSRATGEGLALRPVRECVRDFIKVYRSMVGESGG